MKKIDRIFLSLVVLVFSVGGNSWAQTIDVSASDQLTVAQNSKTSRRRKKPINIEREFRRAEALRKEGDDAYAAQVLHTLVRNLKDRSRRERAVFLLGEVLYDMGLSQAAAFRYLDLLKAQKGRYFQRSLSGFFKAADEIESQSFLDYAVEKIQQTKNPLIRSQDFAFRRGEYLIRKNRYEEAARSFSRVSPKSEKYSKAKYLQGLAYAEMGEERKALIAFRQLASVHAEDDVNGYNINAARMNLARVHYQRQNWDKAIDEYRKIPKDSEFWHEVLFELSWAHFRAGRFREVLGLLSSLHSAYYEDYFLPESILVRSLVYLYICQEDEMEKTLDLFRAVYLPMRRKLVTYLGDTKKYSTFYEDARRGVVAIHEGQVTDEMRLSSPIPIPIVQTITKNPEIRRTFKYLQKLRDERQILLSQSEDWVGSRLGREVASQIDKRVSFAKKTVGRLILRHLQEKRRQFAVFFRQYDFTVLEMKSAMKRRAQSRLAEKRSSQNRKRETVDNELNRNYFSARGIEYWPFNGEYWLDEVGNYHFLGKSLCEERLSNTSDRVSLEGMMSAKK